MSAAAGPKKTAKEAFKEQMEALVVEVKKHLSDARPDAIDAIFKETPALDIWYRPSTTVPPLLYRLLGCEFYIDGGRVIVPHLSAAVSSYLMDLYHLSFPTEDFTYVSDELRKPMLSQKGMTCVSDAFWTLLFESQVLKPFVVGLAKSLPSDDALTAGLCAAAKRYDRINFKQRGRRLSISNNLWKGGILPFATDGDPERGVVIARLFVIFRNIFADNIYEIEGLRPDTFVVAKIPRLTESKIAPTTQAQFMKSFGFLVGFEMMIPKDRKRHVIGFMKNGAQWHILNNDAGYIHIVQDNDWFNNVFMPRLLFSISAYKSASDELTRGGGEIENIHKRVFGVSLDEPNNDLSMVFATLGAKSYPNIYEFWDLFTPGMRGHLWMPYEIVFIAKGDESAAAGAGASGGQRKTRRRPRRV